VLTVTDGTHTAEIKLIGSYPTSTFEVSSDGHGGTIVVDPAATGSSSPHHFIAAMASMTGPGSAPVSPAMRQAIDQPLITVPGR